MSSCSKEVQSVGYQLYQSELREHKSDAVLELHVSDELDWDPVRDEIEELLLFLSGTRPEVRFAKTASSPTRVKRLEFVQPVSTVSLFSGGLDSGAFAVQLGQREPFSILSHTETSKTMYGKARRFRSGFVERGVQMVVSRARSETPQWGMINTRGIVFLSNAMAIAHDLDAQRVVVPENGPMMLNLPVSTQVKSSKTANPYMIAAWAKIVNRVLGASIAVETPYADSTKAEIIRRLGDPEAVRHTYSCFSSQGQNRMCGLCLACFVRITSGNAAEVSEDISTTYIHNPFSESLTSLGDVNQNKVITLTEALDFWSSLADPSMEDVPIRQRRAERITKKWPVMRRHALDVMLGAREYIETGGACDGRVGTIALEVLEKLGAEPLDKRKEELSRLVE